MPAHKCRSCACNGECALAPIVVARLRTLPPFAHCRGVFNNVEARTVVGYDDHTRPLVPRRFGIGHDHHDRKISAVRCGCEPFMSFRDVRISLAHGRTAHPGRVDPGFSGSVIEKQLRITPSKSGCKNRSCCSAVPYLIKISIFPASGAWQLKT
jgi:hypothetical protein